MSDDREIRNLQAVLSSLLSTKGYTIVRSANHYSMDRDEVHIQYTMNDGKAISFKVSGWDLYADGVPRTANRLITGVNRNE